MAVSFRYAVHTDLGTVRTNNEDSAFASPRLLVLADGMGGHVGGEIASAAAIEALRSLDKDLPASELLAALDQAGHPVRAEQVERLPSVCCGGCSG